MAAILLLVLVAAPALSGQRVALVIGNASYAHAPSLANPLNDASDIGASLDRLGFKVTRIENGGRAELWDGLQKFSLAASASEMAVVFYAGHGIEVDKRNFLIPVDARLLSDADVEFEAVPLDLLSRSVEAREGPSSDHPGRLPRQPVCGGDAALRCDPFDRPWTGEASASDAPIAMPRTSRRPWSLTATATVTATETMRPASRTFT